MKLSLPTILATLRNEFVIGGPWREAKGGHGKPRDEWSTTEMGVETSDGVVGFNEKLPLGKSGRLLVSAGVDGDGGKSGLERGGLFEGEDGEIDGV